jgi:hypothetical protein
MENNEFNFEDLENQVHKNIKVKQQETIKAEQEEEENAGITAGWHKGPFIIGGVIAVVLLAISAYIMFIW